MSGRCFCSVLFSLGVFRCVSPCQAFVASVRACCREDCRSGVAWLLCSHLAPEFLFVSLLEGVLDLDFVTFVVSLFLS
jgi:hypothetical protein